MKVLKKKMSLILALMMLTMAVLPVSMVSATSSSADVSMSVKLEGTELADEGTYKVKGGEKIVVKANSNTGSSIALIGYYYVEDGFNTMKDAVNVDTITITVPTLVAGSKRTLDIEAVGANNTGVNDASNRTGWQRYYLVWESNDDAQKEINASVDGKTLVNGSTTTVKVGDKVKVEAMPADKTEKILYKWDNDVMMEVPSATYFLEVPTTPGTHTLQIQAKYQDGTRSEAKKYYITVKEDTTPAEDKINGEVNVAYDGKVLGNRSTTEVNHGDTLRLSATPANRVVKLYYAWDAEQMMEVASSVYDLKVPENFVKDGEKHTLYVRALYDNGEMPDQKTYYFVINSQEKPSDDDPKTNPSDNDLDILPWEKENNELDSLAISLRNDSESDKANKNFYALGEEVTYYVDFKNGGKTINNEVTITLELPLQFKVVDSDNGVVDTTNRTITWTYPEGMEKDYAGTKVVVIKYTAFDRKNTDYKIVYPVATIAKSGKVVDSSAVINFIYVDSDTTLDITHIPYMYGDKNATTFRPDDTITRAEGALVLTRILLGQSAIDNVRVTSLYPDLYQTYPEAQKAIIAATQYGIINGYTDGYYRPNQTMTRAEFMKIIAKFIELNAEDDGIDGLEIKDITNSIKLYKDPVIRYAVNGTTVSTHWAIEEVSLLTRLNMTDASKNRNLRLDEGISRAEVAQLVNFYTFRAPAEVTSRTTTQFSDVRRSHQLFADIVEATRPEHEVRITEDGTEIAK